MVVSDSLYPTENLITHCVRVDEKPNGRKVCISDMTQTTVEVESRLNILDEERDVNCSSDERTHGYDSDACISDAKEERRLDTSAPNNQEENHLYVKATERMMKMESRQMDSYLKQYKDQNDIKLVERRESKIIESTKQISSKTSRSYLKQYNDPNHRRRSPVCSESDVTVMAGRRLYEQAIERLKRHEAKIQEKTNKVAQSLCNLVLPTQTELGKKLFPGYCQDSRVENTHDRLYAIASKKIEEGRMRRTAIEEARARAKHIPETKILPLSQAGAMYDRSMKRLKERKDRLERLAETLQTRVMW